MVMVFSSYRNKDTPFPLALSAIENELILLTFILAFVVNLRETLLGT